MKKNIDSRILLLKIDDSIQSVVLSMVSDKTKSANLFSGRIYISNLNGEFINGYVANNGYITAKLIKKTQEGNPSLMAKQAPVSDKAMDDVCPYEDKSLCGELGTVTITASGGGSDSISIIYIYSSYTYNPQNTTISDNTSTYSWNYGGGSSGNNVNLSPCDYTINGCEDEDIIDEDKIDSDQLTGKERCIDDLLTQKGNDQHQAVAHHVIAVLDPHQRRGFP